MYSLLLLAALPGQFVESNLFPEARQQAAFESTVRIYHDPSRSMGTAVIVGQKDGKTYLLTSAHLVPRRGIAGRENEDLDKVELTLFTVAGINGRPGEGVAFVKARMPEQDLAVLVADLPKHPGVLPLCPNDEKKLIFQLPMSVMTVGAQMDGPPEITLDQVHRKKLVEKPDRTQALYWEANIQQPSGRSGGPMVDSRGYVIGIASGIEHNKGYYTAIDEIIWALHGEGLDWLVQTPAIKK